MITTTAQHGNGQCCQNLKSAKPLQICFVLFFFSFPTARDFKGCRMGRSDKVSLWCVALLINTRFRFFILE